MVEISGDVFITPQQNVCFFFFKYPDYNYFACHIFQLRDVKKVTLDINQIKPIKMRQTTNFEDRLEQKRLLRWCPQSECWHFACLCMLINHQHFVSHNFEYHNLYAASTKLFNAICVWIYIAYIYLCMSEYNLRIRIISDDKHIDTIVNTRIRVVNSAFNILQR